ncbi:hypothetical protein JCM10213v2_006344 [Rhodosporidiobolus nylandii]
MDWEEGPQERLATAGDDTKICIWKPGLDGRTTKSGSKVRSPGLQYGLSEVIDTGHRANIFSVKWAPGLETRLFSAAGDATVRVYDLSLATNPSLSSTTITPSLGPRSLHQPWTHYESASACTHVFRCHTDRVKRVTTEASPDVFLTCGEDGTVRQHDLRTTHTCRTARLGSQPQANCPPPLASYGGGMSLYSLSVSKLRPHLFVVAGTSPYAFLHDRRMLRPSSFEHTWGFTPTSASSSSSADLTTCVRRFGVPSPSSPWNGEIKNHIVATKLSPSKPNELLVSYSEKGVYLFDVDGETYTRPEEPKDAKGKRRKAEGSSRASEDEEEEEGEEDEDYPMGLSDEELDALSPVSGNQREVEGDAQEELAVLASLRGAEQPSSAEAHAAVRAVAESEAVASPSPLDARDEARARVPLSTAVQRVGAPQEDRHGDEGLLPTSGSEEDDEASPSSGTTAGEDLELASASEDDEGEDGSGDGEDEDSEEEGGNPYIPGARARMHHPDVPMVAPLKHYAGHANSQTVKDVNFAFGGSRVVSGSDDGTFFVWDKDSGEVEGIFKGDSSVCNVLQPHPRQPLLAISGIDETVKIFGPTTEERTSREENLVGQKDEIIARNRRGEGRNPVGLSMPSILSLLAARLGAEGLDALNGGGEHGGEEGDVEGELGAAGRGGRRRIRFVVNPNQLGGANGTEERAECAVM